MNVEGEDAPVQGTEQKSTKLCRICGESKPISSFLRRTGRRSGAGARRGTCRECRKNGEPPLKQPPLRTIQPVQTAPSAQAKRERPHRHAPRAGARARGAARKAPKPLLRSGAQAAEEAAMLNTTRKGTVWMHGRTDKGRRWRQEIDLELAMTLVKERMAVLVNRSTIRRLYSNKDFRRYILERDNYTCYFCGEPGDTIDHMLPRAKGGHTTPDNCVCACNACNQSKADQDIERFMERNESLSGNTAFNME
ncbi:HNH endonuclease [Paenibacillus arenilitoris]|uniref:HNH endonuclease n=1 Tax=Paenibacillus arenilitoris TaxID=2772299 RepID=A0A927CG40_9BACL|nr:HNH endonuclease [Paenibacillus arenilitoris]MBD2867448.1 HNH endonuclease [Paenibacillus arenilitoris]